MRAAYITQQGPADGIRVGELPVPVPGPTDVLVRVEVVVVNPVDILVRSGAWATPTPFPFVVGRDLVGTVTEAGPGAGGFAAGDRVWCNSLGHGGRQGSFAEYAVVPAERLYRLPAGRGCWPAPEPRTPDGAGRPAPTRWSTTATPTWAAGWPRSPRPGSTCTSTPPATSTCRARSTCWPTAAASCSSPASPSGSPCPRARCTPTTGASSAS